MGSLSPHFNDEDSWVTLNQGLLAKNKEYAQSAAIRPTVLKHAEFMELVRTLAGNLPVRVHSWVRCPELNGSTPGHSSTSEHPTGRATDFDVKGQTPDLT